MKKTFTLSFCLSLLLVLSSQLVRSQNSVNTVKFKVTYNPAIETYTAYLVPDYSVPNANNPGSTEQGSTAQFTLVVPKNFVITAITDVNGAWDKTPQKLGPGQPNQDWNGYGLDPNLNYYPIGKSASETNYGAFSVGQPVALFTFKGNGCFGPIQPLLANDPFVSAADQKYSLNVSNSFNSRSGQPEGGNQNPLEQFITITGPPTTCLLANPDVATVVVGQAVTIPVLANDRNADGTSITDLTKTNPPALGTPAKGIAAVNPDGTVSYSATPGSSGTDVFSYTVCDKGNSTICSSSTITITIIPSVTASPDAGTVSSGTGGTAVANVVTNDVVNAQPATLGAGGNATVASVGTYPAGISLNPATGSVSVAQGTTPGSYTVTYQLCDKLTPTTCATTTVAITVRPSVIASPDAGTVSAGAGGTAVLNVAANDVVNGLPAALGAGGNATVASVGTYPTGISFNPATGSVSVAQGTTPGSYTVAYQLCDKLTPTTCATTTVAITVTPSVTASPDAGTVSSGTGGVAVANVATNDVVNGVAATLGAGGNATVASVGTYPAGITLNPAMGSVSVAQGTTPGSYTVAYQLCDKLTPTTCATTTVAITVRPSVTASPNAGTVSSGTGGVAVTNVATNDVVNGVAATLSAGGNATVASVGTYPTGISFNPATGSVSVAQGTTPGSYTVAYQLCDKLTPTTCATTTVAITVTPSVIASPDAGTVSSGTGGVAVANVATNDVVNGVAATLGAGGNATVASVGTYPAGITLNLATGSVSVAQGTTPGSYTITYQLCDKLTIPTCTTGLVAITVTPVVTALPDAGTVSAGTGGAAVPTVAANDVVNGQPATLGAGGNATVAAVGTYPAGISLNTTTGSVDVVPGTKPGSYTVAYQLCDKLTTPTCTTTTVQVTVSTSLTATPDAATVVGGSSLVIPILANDKNPDGSPVTDLSQITLPVVSTPAKGQVMVNPDGSLSYTANIGSSGIDLISYTICDKINPSVCRSATITVSISPNLSVVLVPSVYLQGALFGVPTGNPLMRDDLRAKGYVPLSSPYTAQGYVALTPVGATTSAVLSVTGATAVVDWVFVELRDPSSNTLVVDSRAALVLRNGTIVDVDGVSPLSFSEAQSGSYYVAVHHRNHLGVMTAQAIALNYAPTVVDFRSNLTMTYNIDPSKAINQPQVVVDQGVALWAGNALVDKEIIYQGMTADVTVIAQQVINAAGNVFVTPAYKLRGYYTGDVNLNGEVIFQGTGNDVDFIYQNVIKNHPGNNLKQNFFKIKEQLP